MCWTHRHSGAAALPRGLSLAALLHTLRPPLQTSWLGILPEAAAPSVCPVFLLGLGGVASAWPGRHAREHADTSGSPEVIPIILVPMQVTHRSRRQGFRNFSIPVAGGAAMAHGLWRIETVCATDHTRIGLGVPGFSEGPVPPTADLARKH